jgi:hypothetical protein
MALAYRHSSKYACASWHISSDLAHPSGWAFFRVGTVNVEQIAKKASHDGD